MCITMNTLVTTVCLFAVLATISCDSQCMVRLSDPCVCVMYFNTSINCDDVTTTAKLQEHFSNKGDVTLETINIINSNQLTHLPSRFFGSVKFKSLIIRDCGLSSIDNETLQGSKDVLENIGVNNNEITEFNFKSLQNLTKLNIFRLSNDNLSSLPKDAFALHPQLMYIDVSNNNITTLHRETFENLPRVKDIDISYNKITTIGEKVFSLPNNLENVTINLSVNKITSIHKNAFKDLKFQTLDLDGNQLETLERDIFEPLLNYLENSGIESGAISTEGNPFKCDSRILWLVKKPNSYKSRVTNFVCKQNGKPLDQLTEQDLN